MHLSLGLLLLAMGCFAASGQAQDRGVQVQPAGNITVLPGASKRFALLIGVDRYSDAQISSLHGAANAQGEVTLGQLISYLQERVPKQVLRDLRAGKKQVPWAIVEGYRAND